MEGYESMITIKKKTKRRGLDGLYFRIGKENICFSDLSDEQMDEVMKGRNEEWLKCLCKILGDIIYEIGEQFDLISERA